MKKFLKIWLWIFLGLGFLILGSCVTEEIRTTRQLQAELDVTYAELDNRGTIIKQQEEALIELTETLNETIDKLQLLTTFRDAGFNVTSSEVRDLLDLASSLPYGSPFASGHRVTSRFGLRSITRYGWVDQKHLGVDLLSVDGDTTVIMPVDGYISDHGWSDLYGNYIEIETIAGYRIFMAHLDRIYWPHRTPEGGWTLDPEQVVKKGQRIAQMGQTGTYATGVHLHYEIWIAGEDDSWIPLNPEEILNYVGGTDAEG